jgi:hypothetical protein
MIDDSLLAPPLINLEMSRLCWSLRIAVLKNANSDCPAIAAYSVSTMQLPSRHMRPKPRLSFLSVFNLVGSFWTFATKGTHSENERFFYVAQISNDLDRLNGLFDDTINNICHQIYAFTASDNECYTYSQMLWQDNYKQFFQAMEIELDDHETCNHLTLMLWKDIPTEANKIMAIWSFNRKHYPDGLLNKHKAWLCVHGGQQTWGQDYWETYAPVVTWPSVWLLLIFAKIHSLSSESIDYVFAFPQADLDVPVYIELPAGVNPVDVTDNNQQKSLWPQASWL